MEDLEITALNRWHVEGEARDERFGLDLGYTYEGRSGIVQGGAGDDHAATAEALRQLARKIEECGMPCECENEDSPLPPGSFYPSCPNNDDSHDWITSCDDCNRFASDEAAAKALVAAGIIDGYALANPLETDGSPYPYAV